MKRQMMLRLTILLMTCLLALLPVLTALADTVGTVNVEGLVLRRAASRESKALQTLDKGDRVTIRYAEGDWYRVTYGKYGGYVMKQYIDTADTVTDKTVQPMVIQPTAANENAPAADQTAQIKALGGAPAVSRLGDSGDKVRTLQRALAIVGCMSSAADGDFGPLTEQAVRLYQQRNGLEADGIAGEQTITRLFGEKPAVEAAPRTERLDWFHGGSSVIPKGAIFSVKDVKTGKVFRVKRWAGVYHLDAEPASAADTAVMKSVYGGAWSWSRRAILVSYKGHVYAASMNGMPHGSQTLYDNNFNGQFCIHFYGSKTHCGNKVDPDHKACEAAAMKAEW